MTPGMVNGVRCVWPEPRRLEPAPVSIVALDRRTGREQTKPCFQGHIEGRFSNGSCIACHRVRMRLLQREQATERNAKRRKTTKGPA